MIKVVFEKNKNIICLASIVLVLYYFSYGLAVFLRGGDFSVFYCAGRIVLDSDIPNRMIYDIKTLTSCKIPEIIDDNQRNQLYFIYSIPAAYFFSLLTFLPYYYAKALLITLELLSFATAVFLLVNKIALLYEVKPSPYLLLACLWLPLKNDVIFGQINSILLLLIVLACIAIKRYPYVTGFLLGAVSLFKLFPIGVALLLGVRNWRVAVACLFTVGFSIWITNSEEWFEAIHNIERSNATPIYVKINEYNVYWFYGYVISIFSVSAVLVLMRKIDVFFIAAFAITTLFIVMPFLEYHHLVLLIFPLIYLTFFYVQYCWIIKVVLSTAVLFVLMGQSFDIQTSQYLIYLSCLILWVLLIYHSISYSRNFDLAYRVASPE